jgi:hypothetical protein
MLSRKTFKRESEMAVSVARWIRRRGMTAKSEFVTPWGICDFVGLRFNQDNVARRLEQKQYRPITSIIRASLLLQIPDVRTKRSISVSKLIEKYSNTVQEDVIQTESLRLVNDRYASISPRGSLQKMNGWIPLQERLVAVELKLSRIEEAFRQAINNLGFADESYIAFPAETARRIDSNSSRWSKFFELGIGVLAVSPNRCDLVRPAKRSVDWVDEAVQFYCVEKFWSTRASETAKH